MHFAALAYVGESVTDPLAYYDNNTAGTISLLKAMKAAGVKRLVFSSTCATYGEPETTPIVETMRQVAGQPLRLVEMVRRAGAARLRGGRPRVRVRRPAIFQRGGRGGRRLAGRGPRPRDAPDSRAACWPPWGEREKVTVFGTDYPTPDGTCIRDYIHVEDLCAAHHRGHERLAARRRAVLQSGHRPGLLGQGGDRVGPARHRRRHSRSSTARGGPATRRFCSPTPTKSGASSAGRPATPRSTPSWPRRGIG